MPPIIPAVIAMKIKVAVISASVQCRRKAPIKMQLMIKLKRVKLIYDVSSKELPFSASFRLKERYLETSCRQGCFLYSIFQALHTNLYIEW